MVDGCAVNHVARSEAYSALGELYSQIDPIGESDWRDFHQNFTAAEPHLVLIPCIGHFLNNVAKDALKEYEETDLFKLRKAFAQSFYGSTRNSGRGGEYAGVALEVHLADFDDKLQSAIGKLRQRHGMLDAQ